VPERDFLDVKLDNVRLAIEDVEEQCKTIIQQLEELRTKTRDQIRYCCDSPDLRWNGDEDHPGVSCENCEFQVAENGSLVTYIPEELEAITHSKERQKSLFDSHHDE